MLMLALLFAILGLHGGMVVSVDPILDPLILHDQHNNTGDEQSTITFGPLPAGAPYKGAGHTNDNPELGLYLSMMTTFLDVIMPVEPPYGKLVTLN